MKSSNENINKGLIIQFICLIILIALVMWSLFNNKILPYADFMAGITFFVISYNKRKANNKQLSIMCLVFGIFFILMGGWNIFNG